VDCCALLLLQASKGRATLTISNGISHLVRREAAEECRGCGRTKGIERNFKGKGMDADVLLLLFDVDVVGDADFSPRSFSLPIENELHRARTVLHSNHSILENHLAHCQHTKPFTLDRVGTLSKHSNASVRLYSSPGLIASWCDSTPTCVKAAD